MESKMYLKEIKECRLYEKLQRHSFCNDCLETPGGPGERNSCSVCRSFFAFPDGRIGGIPNKHFIRKLEELHRLLIKDKERPSHSGRFITFPFVLENSRIVHNLSNHTTSEWLKLTWLDNRIYVIFKGSNSVQIFSDDFRGLPETLEIEGLKEPYDIVACPASRSIFISEPTAQCLWRLQMPRKTTSRWNLHGTLGNMSVSELHQLIVVVKSRGVFHPQQLFIYRTTNITRARIVDIPIRTNSVHHAVQSHHETFIVSHSNRCFFSRSNPTIISEISLDGRKVLRSISFQWFNPLSRFKSLCVKPDYLTIAGDGRIFVTDRTRRLLVLVNSQLTDCKFVKSEGRSVNGHSLLHISYVQGKQRVVFSDRRHDRFCTSIAHLGPCDANRLSTEVWSTEVVV